MSHRRTEHGHHSVTDELLHHAAVLLDARLRLLVVQLQDVPHVLGVGPVSARRRVDEVDEEDRHELALLLRGCDLTELRAATTAEASARRIGLATIATSNFDSSHPG
jgi:hypothetical protein